MPGKDAEESAKEAEKSRTGTMKEKTKDRNLTEVFQDHLPCSDAEVPGF